MAKDKKSFLLYCDLIHTVEKMPNEKAGELFKHILEYVNDKNPITDDLIIQLSFEPIKQQLKRDLKKFEAICLRNKENIEKRWNTKNTTGKTGTPKHTKNTDSDTDNDTDSDINIPTLEDFLKYCQTIKEYNYAQYRFAYKSKYEAWVDDGWKDGNGKKIKNWKTKIKNTIPYLQPIKNTAPNNINSGII